MELSESIKRWIQEPFPKGFPERLARFRDLAGLSWKDLSASLGVKYERVTGWRRGAVPGGFALLALMRLAKRVPGDPAALFPDIAAALPREGREG